MTWYFFAIFSPSSSFLPFSSPSLSSRSLSLLLRWWTNLLISHWSCVRSLWWLCFSIFADFVTRITVVLSSGKFDWSRHQLYLVSLWVHLCVWELNFNELGLEFRVLFGGFDFNVVEYSSVKLCDRSFIRKNVLELRFHTLMVVSGNLIDGAIRVEFRVLFVWFDVYVAKNLSLDPDPDPRPYRP